MRPPGILSISVITGYFLQQILTDGDKNYINDIKTCWPQTRCAHSWDSGTSALETGCRSLQSEAAHQSDIKKSGLQGAAV